LEAFVPLGSDYATPPFPIDCLPVWLAAWVQAKAEATQTPPDLVVEANLLRALLRLLEQLECGRWLLHRRCEQWEVRHAD
jgi:hypothetical protein